MSRGYPAAFIAALQAQNVMPALFFEGEFTDGWLRLWSGQGDIEVFKRWQTPAAVRNIGAYSEPTVLTQLSARSTNMTIAAMPIAGFLGSVVFPATVTITTFAYCGQAGLVVGAPASISVYVQMDDGGVPVVGSSTTTGDFRLIIGGVGVPLGNCKVTAIGGGIYRVSGYTSSLVTSNNNNGVIKYTGQSARGFRVTGFQIEAGTAATGYQRSVAFGVTEMIGDVYAGAGSLLGFSEIEEGREVVASGMTVTLSGVPPETMATAIAKAQQGAPGRIYLGLFDLQPTGAALVSDPAILMAGIMNVPRVQGGTVINLSYENRLTDLTRARENRLTDEAQQQLYPGDRAFEYATAIQNAKPWIK